MATEDIRVEHQPDAETAYFDVENRVLVLPQWKNMSESMYDMLIGHEVSHALNTPFQEWKDALEGIENPGAFKQIVNVVEDARIERMIKTRFPGLKRPFIKAYTELFNADLFEIKNKNINEMNIIDRLNLHFKLGLFQLVNVRFVADEQTYVSRMADAETFAQVIALSKDLYDLWVKDQEEIQQDGTPTMGNGSGDGQNGENAVNGPGQDNGDQDGQSQQPDGNENGEGDEETDDTGSGAGESEDQDGESQDGESQDGESQDGESQDGDDQEDGQKGEKQSSMDYDDYSNELSRSPSQTQQSFDNAMQDMVDESAPKNEYYTLPKSINLDRVVMDHKEVSKRFHDKQNESDKPSRFDSRLSTSDKSCDRFIQKSKSVVNHMVQEFLMRQAADEDARTDINKSGVLDTVSMINYRWSEDIFLKNETIRDGKSHGMLMYIDWSGSMDSILEETAQQVLILTEFCKKVQIPFEVYAFSSSWDLQQEEDEQWSDMTENYEGVKNPLTPHKFSLFNFLSSRMKASEYKKGVKNFYNAATQDWYTVPNVFITGSTPLNEAVCCAMQQVPEFQASTGVQIVNTVFLTDGCGHSMGARQGYSSQSIVHDPVTKENVEVVGGFESETQAYLRHLKLRTGCNTIGVRLLPSKTLRVSASLFTSNDTEKATKSYAKNNYAIASASKTNYDEMFIIKGHLNATEDVLEKVNEGDSVARIKTKFKNGCVSSKHNRVIATKMIEIFAQSN